MTKNLNDPIIFGVGYRSNNLSDILESLVTYEHRARWFELRVWLLHKYRDMMKSQHFQEHLTELMLTEYDQEDFSHRRRIAGDFLLEYGNFGEVIRAVGNTAIARAVPHGPTKTLISDIMSRLAIIMEGFENDPITRPFTQQVFNRHMHVLKTRWARKVGIEELDALEAEMVRRAESNQFLKTCQAEEVPSPEDVMKHAVEHIADSMHAVIEGREHFEINKAKTPKPWYVAMDEAAQWFEEEARNNDDKQEAEAAHAKYKQIIALKESILGV